MNVYADGFKKLEGEIKTHPLLDLIESKISGPATAASIEKAEKALGKPFSPNLKDFYSQLNGVTLLWKFKNLGDSDWEKLKSQLPGLTVKDKHKTKPFASIKILPVEKCFVNPESFFDSSEKGDFEVEFAGKKYPGNSFGQLLRPFDLYSDTSCMSFVLIEGVADKVMQLSDAYIVWDYSKMSDFDNYIKMLFVTRGIEESRDKVYREYHGEEQPLVKVDDAFVKEFTPPLFK